LFGETHGQIRRAGPRDFIHDAHPNGTAGF